MSPAHAWLIVGLGNPGTEYLHTRHNVGFLVLEEIAKQLDVRFKNDKLSQSLFASVRTASGATVYLAKPQTFMNLSGRSVASLCATYRLAPERVIVISDDVALPFGTLRIRTEGSAGGHNGLKSIIGAISDRFIRFRIGVNPPPAHVPLEAYVLQRFSPAEQKALPALIDGIVRELLHELSFEKITERSITLLPESSQLS